MILGIVGFFVGSISTNVVVFLIGIVLLIASLVMVFRRSRRYSVVNRPPTAPRQLFLVDSWHTSVPDVAESFDQLNARLERAMSFIDPSISMSREIHQYETPYGLEERERLTFTKGQAVVHVHIYPFASDAFVGWDGFLNWAKWSETTPVSRTVKGNNVVEHRSLTTAFHVPSEFDLVEFNALSELIHRRIVLELKAYLKEKEIEADLDFAIIRGDRGRALSEGNSSERTSALRRRAK